MVTDGQSQGAAGFTGEITDRLQCIFILLQNPPGSGQQFLARFGEELRLESEWGLFFNLPAYLAFSSTFPGHHLEMFDVF